MPQITISQAREFLDEISPEDKVAIIFHNDQDGYASTISLSDYLDRAISFFDFDLMIGIGSYLNELKKFDILIFSDVASDKVASELEKIKNKKILYIDHHEKSIEIPNSFFELRSPSYESASYDVFKITSKKEFLTFLGMIADAGWISPKNKNYIEKELKKFKLDLEKAKKFGDDFGFLLKLNKDDAEKNIELLKKIDSPEDFSEIEKIIQPVRNELNFYIKDFEKNKEKLGEIYYYYLAPKLCGKAVVINHVSYKNLDKILVFASPKEDADLVSISARCQTGKNCIELLKAATKNLQNSSAGGHIPAAGGFIQKKDLEKFKENLKCIKI